MFFEWDEEKNQINILKHGYSFRIARAIYRNKDKITMNTKYSGSDDIRYMDIADFDNAILVLVYTKREQNIRVMSLRKSSQKERDLYSEAIRKNRTVH